ncbi:hypothetical protein FRC17_005344 [Serendipita sp. 399]|nr:hypothetical protein FRC17_005344 [Serendipita sp. 399]
MDTTAPTIELRPTTSTSQFARTHVVAETLETSKLTVTPLKVHTNVRLGKNIDIAGYPTRASLFVISNRHGWFFAGHEQTVLASPISELRISLGQNSSEEEADFLCQVKLNNGIAGTTPFFLRLAAEESRLLVASTSSVTVWDVNSVINGESPLQTAPLYSFQLQDSKIVDVQANPGDNPELVAFLTAGNSASDPSVVILYNCVTNTELVRWSGLMGNGNAPLAISWSTRGKQIAIATSSGDILQYSPTDPASAKTTIPRAQGPDIAGTVPLLLQWLSNYTFHVVYAQPKPDESLDEYQPDQHNYIIHYEKQTNHATDTQLPLPWEPYGFAREPGHQTVALKSWGDFKHLCFINDTHATNVGIFACIGNAPGSDETGATWSTISLGEEAITFPLTSELDDTSLIGMSLDVSATKNLLGSSQANGDDPAIPAAPIIYLYTSDAVVAAFHVINEDGSQYPGMGQAVASTSNNLAGTEQGMEVAMAPTTTIEPNKTIMETSKTATPMSTTPIPTGFGSLAPAPTAAFGQSGFGFGGSSAPKFGSSGFGSAPAGPFSAFASQSTTTGPTLGFGAFAASKPTFGQSSFGAPAAASTASATTPPSSSSTPSASGFGGGGFSGFAGTGKAGFGTSTTTTTATSIPAFAAGGGGGPIGSIPSPFGAPSRPGFGPSAFATPVPPKSETSGTTSTSGQPAPQAPPAAATPSPFAQAASSDSTPTPSTTAPTATTTANASTFKISSGFGAFSNITSAATTSAFSNPKPIDTQPKSLTTFAMGAGGGQPSNTGSAAAAGAAATKAPAFGAPTALGQSAFGAGSSFGKPAFGQSSFGQSSFGQSSFGQSSFGMNKSPFATAAASSATTTTGSGFSAFAQAPSSFASLAKASEQKAPAYVTDSGSRGSTAAKESGSSSADGEKKPIGKSPFGSNDAVTKPGFGGTKLRDRSGENEDEEDTAKTVGEKFPEEDADKLEPVKTYSGPGLFETASKKDEKKETSKGLFGGLGFGDKANEGNKSSSFAFGQSIDAQSVASSTAAAFKTQQAPQPASSTGAGSSKSKAPEPVGSAFPASSTTPVVKTAKDDGGSDEGSDEEPEGSIEVGEEDLDDESLEEVDLENEDGLEIQEFLDDEEEEEEEDEEDGEEEEEEGDEDEGEEEEESPDEEEPEESPVRLQKGAQPQPRPADKPLFNPFGPAKSQSTSKGAETPEQRAGGKTPPPVPTSNPQAHPQPATPSTSETPNKPKAKPASPKAAFGSWKPPTSLNKDEPTKTTQPGTPAVQFAKAAGAPPVTASSPATPSTVGQPKGTPEFKAIQPRFPEIQAQLDKLLMEYSVIVYQINERVKRLHTSFNGFKGTGPQVLPDASGQLPPQWNPNNFELIKRTLSHAEEALTALKGRTLDLQQSISDIQSSALLTEARREEASRYFKARQNPEFFEKIIKPRGLGPEHAENQLKLRKGFQLESSRVKELEEAILKLKHKVDSFKAGKQTVQAPSLDTIQKSFKNMEYYLSGVTDQVVQLTARIDSLPPKMAVASRPQLKLSASNHQISLSRTSSIGPDSIATTVEVFAAEIRMTKLRDLIAQSRTMAPINESSNKPLSTRRGTDPSFRRMPFAGKAPVVLRSLPPPHGAPPPNPQNLISQPRNSGSIAPPTQATPTQSSPSVAPAAKPSEEHSKRAGSQATSRHHAKAPQPTRGGPVHTSSFSFGPPPPTAAPSLPANFVPLVPRTNQQ